MGGQQTESRKREQKNNKKNRHTHTQTVPSEVNRRFYQPTNE